MKARGTEGRRRSRPNGGAKVTREGQESWFRKYVRLKAGRPSERGVASNRRKRNRRKMPIASLWNRTDLERRERGTWMRRRRLSLSPTRSRGEATPKRLGQGRWPREQGHRRHGNRANCSTRPAKVATLILSASPWRSLLPACTTLLPAVCTDTSPVPHVHGYSSPVLITALIPCGLYRSPPPLPSGDISPPLAQLPLPAVCTVPTLYPVCTAPLLLQCTQLFLVHMPPLFPSPSPVCTIMPDFTGKEHLLHAMESMGTR